MLSLSASQGDIDIKLWFDISTSSLLTITMCEYNLNLSLDLKINSFCDFF